MAAAVESHTLHYGDGTVTARVDNDGGVDIEFVTDDGGSISFDGEFEKVIALWRLAHKEWEDA